MSTISEISRFYKTNLGSAVLANTVKEQSAILDKLVCQFIQESYSSPNQARPNANFNPLGFTIKIHDAGFYTRIDYNTKSTKTQPAVHRYYTLEPGDRGGFKLEPADTDHLGILNFTVGILQYMTTYYPNLVDRADFRMESKRIQNGTIGVSALHIEFSRDYVSIPNPFLDTPDRERVLGVSCNASKLFQQYVDAYK